MRAAAFVMLWLVTSAMAAETPGPGALAQDIRWDERGGAALRTLVPAGKFVEWCGALREGENVHWDFESAEPMDVNVHYHEGNAEHYTFQKEAVRVWSGTIAAVTEQAYCWMWTNRTPTPVALQVRLQKLLRGAS